jgi:hypothetical protein
MEPHNYSDHDLLVRLDGKVDGLSVLVGELRADLPRKADAHRVDKLESELDTVKARLYALTGGLAALQAVFHWLLK